MLKRRAFWLVHLTENMNPLKLLSTYSVLLIVLGTDGNTIVIKIITSSPHKQIFYVKGSKDYTYECPTVRGSENN